MIRRGEFLLYAVLIGCGLLYALFQREEAPRAPDGPRPPLQAPAAPQRAFAPLPPAAEGVLQAVELEPMNRDLHGSMSIGTAFAINDTGTWLTARHVAQGCTAITLTSSDNDQRYAVARAVMHMGTDLALLETGVDTQDMPLTRRDPERGEIGYQYGFPKGNPSSLRSSFYGRIPVDLGGREGGPIGRIRTTGDVWGEEVRKPAIPGSLGGLSGGPTVDSRGAVIGVTVAEQPRRGRVVTIPPGAVHDLLRRAGSEGWRDIDESGNGSAARITAENFAEIGEDLRRDGQVARAWCLRPGGRGRPFGG